MSSLREVPHKDFDTKMCAYLKVARSDFNKAKNQGALKKLGDKLTYLEALTSFQTGMILSENHFFSFDLYLCAHYAYYSKFSLIQFNSSH